MVHTWTEAGSQLLCLHVDVHYLHTPVKTELKNCENGRLDWVKIFGIVALMLVRSLYNYKVVQTDTLQDISVLLQANLMFKKCGFIERDLKKVEIK